MCRVEINSPLQKGGKEKSWGEDASQLQLSIRFMISEKRNVAEAMVNGGIFLQHRHTVPNDYPPLILAHS